MSTPAEHTTQKVKAIMNTAVWFDLPVLDLDRSIRFYSAVLGAPVHKEQHSGMAFAVLPHEQGGVSGSLIPRTEHNDVKPSDHGLLIYLSCQGRLDDAIAAVAPNGGKVLEPRHPIGPYGFRALILDSEGNRVALHSM